MGGGMALDDRVSFRVEGFERVIFRDYTAAFPSIITKR